MKKIFLDLETTGTDKKIHGVRQISALMQIPGEPIIVFDAKINLPQEYIWDYYVISNMATPDDYFEEQTMEEVFNSFKSFLREYCNPFHVKDKYFLYGYNVKFDADFLRQFFYDNGDKYFGSWFHTPPIDVMSLAAEQLKDIRPEMPNFKLVTVSNALGVEVEKEKLHNSLYDVELTKKIYNKIKHNE